MNNFRDYASRIRSQAAAAAKRIPTFDDMAATDEYIHSEEFNVRGKPRPKKAELAAAIVPSMEPDETSSMGSWSLLDRPPAHLRSTVPQASKEKMESSSTQVSLQGGMESATISTNTSVSSEAPSATKRRLSPQSSSALPLLSVVANTLEGKDDSTNIDALDSGDSTSVGDSDDMDSDLEDDEKDDPILSMIRKDKPSTKQQARVSTKSKSSRENRPERQKKSNQRFMQDLDERMEAGLPRTVGSVESPSSIGMKSPLGGWVQNMARNQFNRILRRTESKSPTSTTVKAPPPLARERTQHSKPRPNKEEEEYNQAASSSMLGDDELAHLAKFKNGVGTCSSITRVVQEYRGYAFIVFTLILAYFVYFFQSAADDVS